VVLERTQGLTGQAQAGHDSDAPVGQPRRIREVAVEVLFGHRALPAFADRHRGPGIDAELVAPDVGDVVLGDVIAESMEEPRSDHVRGGGQVRMGGGVELHEVDVSAGVPHGEPRRDPSRLRRDDGQGLGDVRRTDGRKAAGDLIQGQVSRGDPVGEPARVGHLAEGVDVHCRRDVIARTVAEGVLEDVIHGGEVDLRRLRDGQAIGIDAQRVVGQEARTRRRRGGRHDQEQGEHPGHLQKDGPRRRR
jgi:hypothetical protein